MVTGDCYFRLSERTALQGDAEEKHEEMTGISHVTICGKIILDRGNRDCKGIF